MLRHRGIVVHQKGYWSDTGYAPDPSKAWKFYFNHDRQISDHWGNGALAWAVRDGDVIAPIPEPTTILLLGTGIAGLAGFRRRHREDRA